MTEIAETIRLPESLDKYWSNRGYYGTMNHNVKRRTVLRPGLVRWQSGDAPSAAAGRIEQELRGIHGGADADADAGPRGVRARGDYRWVAEVVNHVVFADPTNRREPRELQAERCEQIGLSGRVGPVVQFLSLRRKNCARGLTARPPRIDGQPR